MIKGGRFLLASKVLHRYSPNIPSIRRMVPVEKSIRHMSDAHPSIGVPIRSLSRITSMIQKKDITAHKAHTPDINFIGK